VKAIPSALPAALLAILVGSFAACQKKETAPQNTGAPTTWDGVTSHLDPAGDLYVYLRTEEVSNRVLSEMDSWKAALIESAGPNLPAPRDQIDAWYKITRGAVQDSGLLEIRALGVSSIQLQPELSRIKSILYSGERTNPGLLWRLGGTSAPHPLAALDFLPANTVYTVFSDFDPGALWQYFQHIVDQIPEKATHDQAIAGESIAASVIGMPIPDLLATMDSEYGIVITADDSGKMMIPAAEGKSVEEPKLAAALLIRVKNDKLYDLLTDKIKAALGQAMPVTSSDANGVRTTTVKIPDTGMPIQPVIARFGNYLAISTSPDLVQALARKGATPPPLLKDDPGFKEFADRETLVGNSFGYLSRKGASILRDYQMKSMNSTAGMPPAMQSQIGKIYDLFSQKFEFAIGRLEPDGYATTAYTSYNGGKIIALTAAVPVFVCAAVALPAIESAKERKAEARAKAMSEAAQAAEANAANAASGDEATPTPSPTPEATPEGDTGSSAPDSTQ
jgi:hypothetical protein